MVVVGLVGLLVYQQISDGPTGPLMGGSFSSGEIVAHAVLIEDLEYSSAPGSNGEKECKY